MANVNVNLNFIATGNFSALHKQIRGLKGAAAQVAQANSRVAAAGVAAAKSTAAATAAATTSNQLFADSTTRARGPLEQMTRAIERQRVGLATLGHAMRNSRAIITQHIITLRAQREAFLQAAGGAKVKTQAVMQKISALKIASMQVRMLNTLMIALGRTMIRVGKNIQWAGRQIMVGIGIPLAILGTLANRVAEDYSREMTRVVKVTNFTAESGTKAFAMQEESVRRQTHAIAELGASMGFLAEESTQTVAEFAQMGFVGRALDEISEAALELSFTAGADLDTSIQMTRIAAQAFNIDLEDLTETFARLNLVENNTALALKEMAIAMPVVAGVANGVGLSIEQTAGFLAVMKENGVSAKEGATALRTGLIRLVQDATDPAREAFQNIGIDLDALNQRVKDNGGDIMLFFETLGNRMKTLEAEGGQAAVNDFTAAIGKLTGTRQAARFLGLIDEVPNMIQATEVANKALSDALDEGADYVTAMAAARDAMNQATAGLADTAGARAAIATWTDATVAIAQYEREQRAIAESAAGIAKRLRAEIQMQLVGIGEDTLAIANMFRQFILDVLTAFNNLGEGTRRAILMFSVFALGLGAVIMTMGLLLNMFGNVTAAIFALLPGLRGKNKLMTEGQAAEIAATNALTRAIQAQTLAMQNKIVNATAVTSAQFANIAAQSLGTSAIGANTAAVQGNIITNYLHVKSLTAKYAMTKKLTGWIMKSVYAYRNAKVAVGKYTLQKWGSVRATLAQTKATSKLIPVLRLFGKTALSVGNIVRTALIRTGLGAFLVLAGAIVIAVMNMRETFEGFRNVAGGAFTELVDIVTGFWELIKNAFSGISGESSEVTEAAMTIGEAFGYVMKGVAGLVKFFVDWFGPVVIGAVELFRNIIFTAAEFIENGFWAGIRQLGTLFRDLGGTIVRFILAPFRRILEAMANIPVVGKAAQRALDFLGERTTVVATRAAQLNRTMEEHKAVVQGNVDNYETMNSRLEEAKKIQDDLIKQGMISEDAKIEELKNSEMLTDEQYEQLLIATKYPEIISAANDMLINQQNILTTIRDLEEQILSARSHQEEVRLRSRLNAQQAELAKSAEEYDKFVASALEGLSKYERPVRDATTAFEDLNFEADDFSDTVDEAAQRAERLVGLLRQAVGSLSGDITTAVNNIYRAQSRALEGMYEDMLEFSRAFFRKFNDDRDEAMRRIRDDIEMQFARDLEKIEDIERAELERLEKVRDEMEEQEKMRERFFAAERARIDFLSGRQIASIETAEALARGDVSRAAIIRIQQEATERQFVLGLLDEERKTFFDLKKEQLEEEMRQAQETKRLAEEALERDKEAALDAVDAAEAAYESQTEAAEEAASEAIRSAREAAQQAQEAEEIRIRNYLREWQSVTPATEEEYQQHLAKLNKFLDKSGSRMTTEIDRINKRLNRELQEIGNNFGVETDSISADLGAALDGAGHMSVELLRHIDMVSGQAFSNVANQSMMIAHGLRHAFVSSEALTNEFLRWFEAEITNGFQQATTNALNRLLEDEKWAEAGRKAGEAFSKAFDAASGGSSQPDRPASLIGESTYRPEYGMELPDLPSGLDWGQGGLPNIPRVPLSERTPTSTLPAGLQWGQGGLPMMPFAKGGIVRKPIFPALVGEAGPEAIIPLDQIDKVFGSLMTKKFMAPVRGMVMEQSRELMSEGAGAKYNLAFNIYDANIDEDKLARKVMFEIDRAHRNTGGGRTVRMV